MSYIVLVVFSVIALPFMYVAEAKKIPLLRGVGFAIFLIGLFLSKFTIPQALRRQREDPTLSFRLALSHTIYSHIRFLCFIPLIGPVLSRLFIERKAANPFTAENDPSKDA